MNENKTNINWYPGHMAKTKRLISENIDAIYCDIKLSTLNMDSEFTKECVIIHGISDLLL